MTMNFGNYVQSCSDTEGHFQIAPNIRTIAVQGENETHQWAKQSQPLVNRYQRIRFLMPFEFDCFGNRRNVVSM